MIASDFRPLLGGGPFRPFAPVMFDGERVEVRSPQLAAVARASIRVTETTPTGRLTDRTKSYPLPRIRAIEFLDGSP